MVKNHYFKERKKAKKERKPVGQPVGAKVQGWPTNPKTKILNKSGKKQSGRWGTCPGLAVCLVQALRGDRLTWLSFLFWQIGNLKEQFVEAGGLKASVARAWSEAEQTGRLLPCGATRLWSEAKRKSDWFRAR